MKMQTLSRNEKALFAIPLLCFIPLALLPLTKDLLSKKVEQLSTPQTVDCGIGSYNSNYSHQPTSDEANACMAQGIKSGRGFLWRQEEHSPIPRFYTGEYQAMAIVCVPDNRKARRSTARYRQPAYILSYHCSYKFGARFNERVSIRDQIDCGIFGAVQVFCGGK